MQNLRQRRQIRVDSWREREGKGWFSRPNSTSRYLSNKVLLLTARWPVLSCLAGLSYPKWKCVFTACRKLATGLLCAAGFAPSGAWCHWTQKHWMVIGSQSEYARHSKRAELNTKVFSFPTSKKGKAEIVCAKPDASYSYNLGESKQWFWRGYNVISGRIYKRIWGILVT